MKRERGFQLAGLTNPGAILERALYDRGADEAECGAFPETSPFAPSGHVFGNTTSRVEEKICGKRKICPLVLVPSDLSPASMDAARTGVELARRWRGQLLLLHAVHLNLNPYGPANLAGLKTRLYQTGAAQAEQVMALAQSVGVPAIYAVEEGTPATVIRKAADRWQADVIILAARRHQGFFDRIFRRRTAEKVIRMAKCPVFVLHID